MRQNYPIGGIQSQTTLNKDSNMFVPTAKAIATRLGQLMPALYNRDIKYALKTPYTTAANRYTILTPNYVGLDVNGTIYFIETQQEIDLSVAASWDTTAGTDYTVAANRVGLDFYLYACEPASGNAPDFVVSANSTTPSDYTADNSRKIGGFHCLCVAVGTIGGHTLTGFLAGDVLPLSIWDLRHRAEAENIGLVYSEEGNGWVDIYLASGTGASTASVNGGTISDTRDWNNFVDDFGAVRKRLLTDVEFQLIAAGIREEAQIWNGVDPVITGGHSAYFLLTLDVGPAVDWAASDTLTGSTSGYTCTVIECLTNLTYICKNISNTAGFTDGEIISNGANAADQGAGYPTWAANSKGRIISNIGCEDCCGVMYQWLQTSSVRADFDIGLDSGDVASAGWYDLPGNKGSFYTHGTSKYMNTQLMAGLYWADGAGCGSRGRYCSAYRWATNSNVGGRGWSPSRKL